MAEYQIVGKWSFSSEGNRKQENIILENFDVEDDSAADTRWWSFLNQHKSQYGHLDLYQIRVRLQGIRTIRGWPKPDFGHPD